MITIQSYHKLFATKSLKQNPLSVKRASADNPGFLDQQTYRHGMDISEAMRINSDKRTSDFNTLTPNDPYRVRTAPLTSKRCVLYIYSTKICTEYFKHVIYSPFFSLQSAVCFIILTYLVPVIHILCTMCAKIKKNNSGSKRLKV